MPQKKVVITGGPGTGKTSIVTALEKSGFTCFHEIIRTMTDQVKGETPEESLKTNPLAFVSDPYLFNQKILNGRIDQFNSASQSDKETIFFDRGLPDVLAYMEFFNQSYGKEFITPCYEFRYDHVVILPPWEAIYVSDSERMETFQEAEVIYSFLDKTYRKLGYLPIFVPKGTVEERAAFILNSLDLDNG